MKHLKLIHGDHDLLLSCFVVGKRQPYSYLSGIFKLDRGEQARSHSWVSIRSVSGPQKDITGLHVGFGIAEVETA